jgi:hypothetical protein
MRLGVEVNTKSLRLHFDRDYGSDKRSGWSIAINGSFYCELERHLFIAIFKAIRKYRYFHSN